MESPTTMSGAPPDVADTPGGGPLGQLDHEARRLLVDLLREAAKLEHCLLNAYLFAACSLRSAPEEFASDPANRRGGVQFERVRAWKQGILGVAREEMLHLHYVQSMLRALGEPAEFALPDRAPSGGWSIPSWRVRVGDEPAPQEGVDIPVSRFDTDTIRHFVLFESTDALQDADPFGPDALALYGRIGDAELDLRLESMLLGVDDAAERADLKSRLGAIYSSLTPATSVSAAGAGLKEAALIELPPASEVRFQSIADLYLQGILPLFRQAFERGWVHNSNRDLNNELIDPDVAGEGFLIPFGPIYRDQNFNRRAASNFTDPLTNFGRVDDVIREIVTEGEGATDFTQRVGAMLDAVSGPDGARLYLQAVQRDSTGAHGPTPEWLASAQRVRQSHLYQFAFVLDQLRQEEALAGAAGTTFTPARQPLPAIGAVARAAGELPCWFNASYLVLTTWLGRMYEVEDWTGDKPRRQAIEMLASWPLMSMAVRPFLELASFLPVDTTALFSSHPSTLPRLPLHARELYELSAQPERTREVDEVIDALAIRVLADTAAWAASTRQALAGAGIGEPAASMIQARLDELSHLDEFRKEFPFRSHGGYSDREPDLTYIQDHPGGDEFEENPATLPVLFPDKQLVLRVRFSGWGLVQLATDPDPPFDEAGCTGTHMAHPSDGHALDRALVWTVTDPAAAIERGPAGDLPRIGVEVVESALLLAGRDVAAGYTPLQILQSTGAVQTSGVQQNLSVGGLIEVLAVDPTSGADPCRLDLLTDGDRRPFLNGLNHVVSQDGEAIDPFTIAVLPAEGSEPVVQRAVHSPGTTFLGMSPLQRLMTSRRPCGFDSVANMPEWVRARLTPVQQQLIGGSGFPMNYLAQRCGVLVDDLRRRLHEVDEHDPTADSVNALVSVAERLRLVAVPRGTTVGWLTVLLHYGHTVSGPMAAVEPAANPLLQRLAERTGLPLDLESAAGRGDPNGRWLVSYTKGVMDTDALSDLVYGELFVPLRLDDPTGQPLNLERAWRFAAPLAGIVVEFACRFESPFWAPYTVDGTNRSLPGPPPVTETLVEQDAAGYRYQRPATPDVTAWEAAFTTETDDVAGLVTLRWAVQLTVASADVLASELADFAATADAMSDRLRAYFAPS